MARTGRRVGTALLGAVLVAGGGVYAAQNGYLRAPLPAAEPHLVTAETVCAWRGGAESDASVPLGSPTGDLAIATGVSTRYRVTLTNGQRAGLRVPATSAPVLLATTISEGDAVVVGYALPDHTPAARLLARGEVAEHEGFGAFLACPGAPLASDGEHLAAGSYALVAGQALGRGAPAEAAPFNTWARVGTLTLTSPATAAPAPAPPPTPRPAAGTCGTNLDNLPSSSSHHATFDQLDPVLVIAGAAFDPDVRMTNHGPLDLEDVIQGGPLLLVTDPDNVVVARSESIDPLPGPGLAPGATLTFGRFAALVDCTTGEDLPPGDYQLTVAQQARDPEPNRPIGTTTRYGELTITDDPAAERVQVRLPELPACGAPIEGFTFDSSYPAVDQVYAGLFSWDEDALVDDAAEGFPRIELAFTYDGPQRAMWPAAYGIVLARDGVVVARTAAMPYEAFEPHVWEAGSARSVFLDTGSDCAESESYDVSFEPSGPYTAAGFYAVTYEDSWGLTQRHVTVFGPVEIEFPER